jgi:S-adenosylmethionine:tRNA ribosyltransferase-isomerase
MTAALCHPGPSTALRVNSAHAGAQSKDGLIEATEPPEHRGVARDAVRLLVTDRASRTQTHTRFFELPSFLRSGDLLVVNDSATVPAAIVATRPNGQTLPLHVATMIDSRVWTAEPRGPALLGEELRLPNGGSAVMIAPVEPEHPRLWYVWFQLPLPMHRYLAEAGEPVRYGYVTRRFPLSDYQTMFGRVPGSAEMPSAARPFTPRVVAALHRRGVGIAVITLHCGVSSFEAPERPPTERFAVTHEAAEAIDAARREGRRVIAVGTTALRALESAFQSDRIVASSGWTDLVIDAQHAVRSVDGLLTGFHDPAATHLWMLQSFLDRELLGAAYDEAAENGYRYHEFGDVHLIL